MNINQVDASTKPKGLENIGATCYMNAVLQCFYHVKVLTNELLKYPTTMPMTLAYQDVIKQLSVNSPYPGRPFAFKNVISGNPLFRGIQANDSKDLILYFLETIENELSFQNFICQNQKYFNRIKFLKNNQDIYQDSDLMNIIKLFENNHKSIISDLFYGFRSQLLICEKCKKPTTNYQIFNLFIFPIEVVYNNKMKNNRGKTQEKKNITFQTSAQEIGRFYYEKNENRYFHNEINIRGGSKKVTLEDCFENEIGSMDFNGDNQIYCNNCSKSTDAKGINKIYCTPYILILVLNRGKGNEFDCEVDFKEDLNIKKYVQRNDCPLEYNLIGVISHLGESSMNGHFIADCKHFDGGWYSFSDSSVSGPYNKYNKKGTPYILFYQFKGLN